MAFNFSLKSHGLISGAFCLSILLLVPVAVFAQDASHSQTERVLMNDTDYGLIGKFVEVGDGLWDDAKKAIWYPEKPQPEHQSSTFLRSVPISLGPQCNSLPLAEDIREFREKSDFSSSQR